MVRTILGSLALMGVCLAQAPAPVDPAEKLIEEIETMASAEPPLLGIDTQVEAARILLAAKRQRGSRMLDDAMSRIRSIEDPRTLSALLLPAVELLFKHAPEEASRTVSAYLAEIQGKKSQIDYGLLLDSFEKLVRVRYPELADACEAEFEKIRKADPPKQEEVEKSKPRTPSVEGLDLDAVIALARKQKEPLVRIEMALGAIDDADTPVRRRAALASEFLPDTEKLPLGDDRLVSQSMLTRRLHEAGDRPGAALAAQMLEQTFIKMYDCESAACTSFQGEGPPGELVRTFAEYLGENRIDPADIGLTHRSLRVRMMLIQLEKLLDSKALQPQDAHRSPAGPG